MDQKTYDLLTQLLEKFGVVAENFYQLALFQAHLIGTLWLFMVISFILILIKLFKITKKKTTEHREGYYSTTWSQDAWLGFAIVAFILLVAIFGSAEWGITALFNPEFYAAGEVVKAVAITIK